MTLHDRALFEDALRLSTDFFESLPSRKVSAAATLDELRAALHQPLSAGGIPEREALAALATSGDRGVIASAGPRYFGFVIGGSYPVAVAADWLVSAWDQNPGIYATSPVSAVIEEATAGYVLELLDLPRESSVGFVTGCQMANFTALAAARHAVLSRQGWNVEERGMQHAPDVNIVISEEAHITIIFALRLLGLGTASARRVACDEQGRMRADDLERVLAGCEGPTIVCTQAGNVNSGSFDPIASIVDIAHRRGAWVHVDGAFGMWARVSPRHAHLVVGVERADSWATDAHKWLNVPYDCGIVIVRDREMHRGAMSLKAPYLQQTEGIERDAVDWVPDFSRRGRSIPLYATLLHLGHDGVRGVVERCCTLARRFAEKLGAREGVEILNDVVLNQVLVRFANSDDVTRAVVAEVQREGVCWLGGSTWRGMGVMRISVSNWSTSEADVDVASDAILRAFERVSA